VQASVLDLASYKLEALGGDGELGLYRAHRADTSKSSKSVLIVVPFKEPSAAALRRMRDEYAVRDALDGAGAVRALAPAQLEGRSALVLEDPGGMPLDRLLSAPLPIARFLRLAAAIATALGQLHKRGLVHKDVKPANILVDAAEDRVWLLGLGLASRLPRERQSPQPPELIAGTLAYMAPEQTGRMNRSVDSRSDLYALGVTLYQMLTASLPFNAADPTEWVHCHIARTAVPPHERCAEVPSPVSAIVMKLLAKTAEERYQTAGGVEHDLRRCLDEWEARRRIDEFPLGGHDTPDRLVIPEKLYGRSNEIAASLEAFEHMVGSGRPRLLLISGYSGIGKSSVVNELHRALVPSRALFASGKFDQYKRDIPYATLAQAFQDLVRTLLAESETELAGWREALQQALGPNAALIVDLVPEVKLIIGEPAPVIELPPQDAQRRFQLLFRRFIGVFAQPEHPLVLFLDDLQWLDAATLDLLEQVLIEGDGGHLLLIGAYRDNEVDTGHPLARRLAAIRAAGARVQDIHLDPLARGDVTQLIADALCCGALDASPLAQLMHDKTAGNPFFVIQFLRVLAEEGLLAFDHAHARWSWDLDRIHAKGYTDNVADLMVRKLSRLPIEARSALRQLACLGTAADTSTLSLVCGTPECEIHEHLWEAVRQGLIERDESSYGFVHDRIREAAYSLIPPAERAETHLRIGRLLAAQTPAEKQEETIFEIVNQLDRGAALITSRDEREQLAELNLIAGQRAKSSTAYASALNYFVTGGALLADDSWDRRHPLAFSLELNRAECEFLTGMLPAAEARLAALSTRAANAIEQASLACLRVDLYTTLSRSDRAVAVGLDCLRQLGIQWSEHPSDEEVRLEYEALRFRLGNRAIEELLDLPLMSQPLALATLDVLTALLPPAFFTDANLRALVILKAVNLSVEWGNSDASCTPYVMLGMVAGARFGDYQAGLRFSKLGKELVEHRGLKRFQARTYLNYANVVMAWTQRFRSGRDLLRRAFEIASNSGDLTFAAYSCASLNVNFLASGDPLPEAQCEAENGLRFAENARFGFVVDIIKAQLALIRMLRGLTARFGVFDDGQFEELGFERHLSANRALAVPESWYWIRKLQARFFAGDYASAVDAAEKARRLRWAPPQLFEVAEYEFYCALSRAAICDSASPQERQEHLEALRAHHRHLEGWAQNCPENFSDRAALVAAEIARIQGHELDAEHLYQQAIRAARANGLVHNEALAHELAARFYAGRGFEEFAHLYLQKARHCYLRWGADGKVRQLDGLYPYLRQEEARPSPPGTIAASVEHLDLATVLKVSQAVSGEFVLDNLIDKLMRAALEHAGAQRALLMDSREGVLQLEAEAVTSGNDVIVRRAHDPIETVRLPVSIVNYVSRTHEVAILDDAARVNSFSLDEYIRDTHARSILCLPLIKGGQVVAVLYLENNLAPGVFTAARVAVLKLLASEAATSLENSRLYRELQERESKFRRLVDSNIIGVVIADLDGPILEANDAFLSMLGYSQDDVAAGRLRWPDITPPEWLDVNRRAWEQTRAIGRCEPFEKEYLRKDGSRVPVLIRGTAFDDDRSKAISFVLDLSERKRAEDERRAHLWFLESMDRINRAIQGSNDLERMMSEVLNAVLEVFACDRAWLLYPCDPDAPSWRAVMEHTRPQFPGAFALKTELPVDAEVAAVFAAARASAGVVHFQPNSSMKVPAQVAERFAICSQIAIAVHPKGDRPYLFGLHQCSYARAWTAQEERLFQEIGRRLADALTSLLMFRSLQESERRLEEAQRIAHVGWWERDLVSFTTTVSAEACCIFGLELPEGRTSLTDRHERFRERVHPEDRARTAHAVAIAQQGGPGYDLEYRVVQPSGDVRIVHSRGEVMWDESGRACRLFGMMQDITQLRHAESGLRASEARFRTFVDHATDAFFLLDDRQLTVVDVNRQACESLGYSREELIGRHPRDFDIGLDEPSMAGIAERVGAGETVTFETSHRRKDGTVFPVEIRARQFLQGRQRLRLALVRDITERKLAEEEHRAHVWFLESMDRINRAMQGSADLEQMMRDVLDVVLDVFACDRAWLIYPCDPHARSWRVLMERTGPQIPGAFAPNADLPTDTEKAAVFASALASTNAPVLLLPAETARRFAIRSQIAMAVHPKVDQAYLFGLHQCSYERIWTEPEKRLFQEVASRLAGGLTSLLMFRTLQQSERKLEAAQRIARVGWWERDFRTNRVSLSDEVRRTFGMEPVDLPHWHERWMKVIHPEDRPKTAAAAAAALNGGPPYDVEYRVVRPDGSVRVVHSQGEVIRDESGRPLRQFGMLQDITALRQAEQELRTSEERFRTLVQFSFDVYWETDAQHRFTRQEFREGLADAPEPGSEIGKTRWEVPYLEPDEEAWRQHRATLDAHLPFRDFEIARPASDGGKRYVSVSGLPVFDETGRFIGYRGVGRHITQRKRAEQELKRLHLQLVHMSRVMTTAELATSIAHEVNQPLGSILASVGPCLRWLNAQPPDLGSARGALERIANDAERASQVISRIRALVRREPLRHERVDLNAVISEVIALTRDQMHSHDVALQSTLAADLTVVHGDRVQLQQVMLNLIANAVEAMSTILDRRRQLAILSANDASGVRVEVRDCGPGVDPDGAQRIFEPFYTTKADGIGMGLWICRSIIEAHGGRLWVTPNPPRGAAFQFWLPGTKPRQERATRQGGERKRSSRSEGRVDR
jgi:PAS domain S-box-containing protein